MTVDPDLARLAAAHGVATEYKDQLDRTVDVSPQSVVAVLAALGVDASTPAAVRAALAGLRAQPGTPSVIVMRESETVTLPTGTQSVVSESGESLPFRLVGGRPRQLAGTVLGQGWHALHTAGGVIPLVVAPDRLTRPRGRHWGLMVQLYAMRSRTSWGIGDLHDLSSLVGWTGAEGGGLVLVNPLHATVPTSPLQDSPYYPASRRWTNPIYLRVEDTSAYAAAPADVRAKVAGLRVADAGDRIERDEVWRAKRGALEMLFAQTTDAVDLERVDPGLLDWATWCALAQVHGPDWRTWAEPLRRPDSPAVDKARHELADAVRFHAWLQLLCDEQLGRVQDDAKARGLPIGVVHDLAVGTDPAGADAWALQDALALGARIGAPPDTFNQQGQDWGMPPWHPQRLAELGYAPLRDMVRGLLRHSGGVRIDHVLGLFRMWWVPADGTARDGTYVSYDANALLGVVTLEAERAGAMVIGEDLGTVTPVVRRELASRGVLGSSVLWFEREDPVDGEAGPLRPLTEWREQAAASISTHDLPTALGWLRGEHVRVRADLGLLDDPSADEHAWLREREEVVTVLREAGLVGDAPTDEELVEALNVAVAATPSRIVLVAPGDVVGDVRQPNLPGTTDEYPSWRLPVADEAGRALALEDVLSDPRMSRLAAVLRQRVR